MKNAPLKDYGKAVKNTQLAIGFQLQKFIGKALANRFGDMFQ